VSEVLAARDMIAVVRSQSRLRSGKSNRSGWLNTKQQMTIPKLQARKKEMRSEMVQNAGILRVDRQQGEVACQIRAPLMLHLIAKHCNTTPQSSPLAQS